MCPSLCPHLLPASHSSRVTLFLGTSYHMPVSGPGAGNTEWMSPRWPEAMEMGPQRKGSRIQAHHVHNERRGRSALLLSLPGSQLSSLHRWKTAPSRSLQISVQHDCPVEQEVLERAFRKHKTHNPGVEREHGTRTASGGFPSISHFTS